MKLLPISSALAIATTLLMTTVGAIAAIQSISNPSPELPVAPNLIAQNKSVLATLQGKPLVVDIYASWCPGCKNIAPTLSQLRQQYTGKASFVVFDVSDRQKTQASMKLAAKLGLSSFFAANKSQTATVAIIDPATGKVMKQFRNNAQLTEYTSVLDLAIAKSSGGNAMGDSDAMKKP